MNRSQVLHNLGQSIWFDNIDRDLIKNGWFKEKIQQNIIFGVTSNPSIFKKSISSGNAYTQDIQSLSWSGLNSQSIFEKLVISDIQNVADLLQPIYKRTEKVDGYVSLEVDPLLANNANETIKEATRLWNLVDRKNLIIKIPATNAGISAISKVIAAGINVNVTLIFSPERYEQVIDAYLCGLEKRLSQNLPIDEIHSVASVFVSRFDAMLEKKIEDLSLSINVDNRILRNIKGKAALQNSLYIYELFSAIKQSTRFNEIESKGGNLQRPLWASTSTKNPDFNDVLYIDELILPQTVNTVPPKTLEAFLDHGKTELIEMQDVQGSWELMKKEITELGIDIEEIYENLEEEGVQKFAIAQKELLNVIETERKKYLSQINELGRKVGQKLKEFEKDNFIGRFFQPDPTLFTSNSEEADEVLHRLGWVSAPDTSIPLVEEAEKLKNELLEEGFTHAVVLGMGGSSLAPEVFSEVLKEEVLNTTGLSLSILDSTDPEQICNKANSIPIEKTLFIASSKSGTTAEMKSLVAYFFDKLLKLNIQNIGSHFIAITDPGTPLESFATENKFRKTISADPNVGGRYSALIAFGIVPAVLMGVDGSKLLSQAKKMSQKCSIENDIELNPAILLAVVLSEAYINGMDKLTIISDEKFLSVGSWLEQLIAESSGKNSKGLTPIDLEPILDVESYSQDRIFYYLRHDGKYDDLMNELRKSGKNVIESNLLDGYDLSAEMYKWEFATAVFCSLIGVNPFNQPNVQASKSLAIKMIEDYRKDPKFDEGNIVYEDKVVQIFSYRKYLFEGKFSIEEFLDTFLAFDKGQFLAINAFLPRIPEFENKLTTFRKELAEKYHIPTTLGFGPRFLHSTGQLHKGGKNNGKFIVLTQSPQEDMEIPGEGINFSILEKAQGLGDMQALDKHNRQVVRIHFKDKFDPQNILFE